MTEREFHSGLRALFNLDRDILVKTGILDEDPETWARFRDNPAREAIKLDDRRFGALWVLVAERAGIPVCPYCGETRGLRKLHDGHGAEPPDYSCREHFSPPENGPDFDDLEKA